MCSVLLCCVVLCSAHAVEFISTRNFMFPVSEQEKKDQPQLDRG